MCEGVFVITKYYLELYYRKEELNYVIRTEGKRTGSGRVCIDPCFGRRSRHRDPCLVGPSDWSDFQQYRQRCLIRQNKNPR